MVKIIKFKAKWCGPCTTLAPIFDQVISELSGVDYQEVDVDQEPMMAINHKVKSLPTIIVLKDDVEVERIVGVKSKVEYVQLISKHL